MDEGRNIILSLALHLVVISVLAGGALKGVPGITPPGVIRVHLEYETAGLPETVERPARPDQAKVAPSPVAPAAPLKPVEPAPVKPHVRTITETPPSPSSGGDLDSQAPAEKAAGTAEDAAPGLRITDNRGGPQSSLPGRAPAEISGSRGSAATTSAQPDQAGAQRGGHDLSGIIRSAIYRAKYYPVMAKKRGIEGTVSVEFSINSRGYPENIRITGSSGSDILDAAAKETIAKAAPFPHVSGAIAVPIVYRLDKDR